MGFTYATSTPGIEFIPRFHLHYFDEFFQADFFGIFPLNIFLWSGQSQCFSYDITSSRVVVCSNKPSHCCIVHTSCGGIYNTVVRFTRFPSGGFTSVAIVKKLDEKLVKSATVQYPPTSSQAFQRKEKSKQPLCQRHELCTPMQCMNVYTRPYISNFGAKIRSSHSILLYHHVQFSFKRLLCFIMTF